MKTQSEFQRRIYPSLSSQDKSQYREFSTLDEAQKDMPFTLQVQWEDLEDFDNCPTYMVINEIRDGEDYNSMYFIEMKYSYELRKNQFKHF